MNLQWVEPISISIDTTYFTGILSFYIYPKTKNVLFAWESIVSEKDTNNDIFYREYIDGKLSSIQNISNNPSRSTDPILDVDRNSNIHLLWGERIGTFTRWSTSTDLFYTTKKGGGFQDPVSIFRRNDTFAMGSPYPFRQKMKIDSKNNVHVFLINRDTTVFEITRHLIKKDSVWTESSVLPYIRA
jgi:hypothetical protein